jgi:mono/diheme cytochrome c family protein
VEFSVTRSILLPLISLFVASPLIRADDATAARLWTEGVQPLLDQHCVKCHGPLEQKSKLELDSVASVLKGSEDGPVVVPGKPDESLMMEVFAPKSDPHMPPKKQLSDHEIAKIRTWIAALGQTNGGEPVKVARPEIPPASADPIETIDHFLTAEWQARGITPAPVCDDRTFVRRVYLDLAGRIPTRDEASVFLADTATDKRAKLVDHLLSSDEYPRTFREVWDALLMGRRTGRREQRRRESGWYEFLELRSRPIAAGMKLCVR